MIGRTVGPYRSLALILAVLILLGCNRAGAQPSGTDAGTRPPSQDALAADAKFRSAFGLRSDDAWVLRVAEDRLANVDFGVPLTAAEAALVHRKLTAAKSTLLAVHGYARQLPEYGGGFVDIERGGLAVVSFSGRVEEHRAALEELVGPDAPLVVEQVSLTYDELLALKQRVLDETEWMRYIGAELVSVGIKPSLNMVHVRVSSANPAAEEAIVDHFGARGAMYVDSDGIGVRLMPTGTLVLTARDGTGRPVPDLLVDCGGDLPDTGTGDVGTATDLAGQWRAELTATGYDCNLRSGERSVGSGRAVVPAGGTAHLNITIEDG